MSPARLYRERLAAAAAVPDPSMTIASGDGGGQSFAASGAVSTVAATIAMRLAHDLRRLKDIKSIDRKIAAKREMLPEYTAWCDGMIDAARRAEGRELAPTGADDVLPTVMVWSIDVGDWPRALALAAIVLRFGIALPARYERDAATLVLEEIAEAALKIQARGEAFPLTVLEAVEQLTCDVDMHDEPRAKLFKAIGTELARSAALSTGDAVAPTVDRAIAALTKAQGLHERVGVKTQLRGLEKIRTAIGGAIATDGSTGPDPQAKG